MNDLVRSPSALDNAPAIGRAFDRALDREFQEMLYGKTTDNRRLFVELLENRDTLLRDPSKASKGLQEMMARATVNAVTEQLGFRPPATSVQSQPNGVPSSVDQLHTAYGNALSHAVRDSIANPDSSRAQSLGKLLENPSHYIDHPEDVTPDMKAALVEISVNSFKEMLGIKIQPESAAPAYKTSPGLGSPG